KTIDNGYLFSGDSYSNISGDKTEINLGVEQSWIVKTDSLGNKQWDKTIFTTGHDEYGDAIQTKDSCYVIVNNTSAGIGGYKTQSSWSSSVDYWFVKFCDTTSTTGINSNLKSFSGISIFPNPVSSILSIELPKQTMKLLIFKIHNVFGQTVFYKIENNPDSSHAKTINLSFLSKGIYFLDLFIDGEHTMKKIVKE
ncbi:MAG TPA: T9SS type A sorting domain-containing protein, partial [Bacteroidia bacterium]|nr:T9SS type A sorting domain-containing protein [Bacteroidia bacterium]